MVNLLVITGRSVQDERKDIKVKNVVEKEILLWKKSCIAA